mgnify:CR=1 FL=1
MKKNHLIQIVILWGIFSGLLGLSSCSKEKEEEEISQELFKGNDITAYAEIFGDPATKNARYQVHRDGNWKIYAGINDQKIDFTTPVKSGNRSGEYTTTINKYQVYCLEWGDGSRAPMGMRKLPFEKQDNFRDMGGYKTRDGKIVKWGKIFRSGTLEELHAADISYLGSSGIKTVIDLRSETEKNAAPDRLPSSVIQKPVDIETGDLGINDLIQMVLGGDENVVTDYFIDLNKKLVLDYQDEYKELFKMIQEKENLPLVFHCTAGKDRAGFAAALLLSALGVERDVVLEDYLLTNICSGVTMDYIRSLYGNYGLDDRILQCIFNAKSAKLEYINAAFDTIEIEYGSVERFLTGQLGVDIEKLKKIYLY